MREPVGRVALVTGAGSGLGKAFGELWLDRYGPVVGVDLRPERLDWLERRGAVVLAGDVTDPAVNERAVSLAEETFGRLDAAVFSAGISAWGDIEQLDLAVHDRVMAVNVRAVALGLRAAAPAFRRAGGGAAVIIASVSGLGGEADHWSYCTSKAAVLNLARSAAIDLARHGIRVNTVCPGPVHTDLTRPIREADPAKYEQLRRALPMQRWGEQEEVAEVIAFLASPAASFVTGATVPVDGGVSSRTGQLLPPQLEASLG